MKAIKQTLSATKIFQEAVKGIKAINRQISKDKDNFDKEWNKWGIVPKKRP